MHASFPPLTDTHSNARDRRRHLRRNLYADAMLSSPSVLPCPCKIRDYCPEGVFVSWEDNRTLAASSLAVGTIVNIAFEGASKFGNKRFQIFGTVARKLNHGLGLAIRGQDPEAMQVLETMADQFAANESQSAQLATVNSKLGHLQPKFRAIVQNHIGIMLSAFTAEVDKSVFMRAKHASNNNEQTMLLDALPVLNENRERIKSTVTQRMIGYSDHLGESLPNLEQAGGDSMNSALTLLDKDDFEDLLAIADMISHAEQRYKTALFDLEQRLAFLIGRVMDRSNNPIGPSAIFNCFASVLQQLGLNSQQRLATYDALQETVMPLLAGFYKETNEFLVENGILPDVHAVKRPAAPRPRPVAPAPNRDLSSTLSAPALDAAASVPPAAATIAPQPVDLQAQLQNFLGMTQQRPPAPTNMPDAYFNAAQSLLDLQHRAAPMPAGRPFGEATVDFGTLTLGTSQMRPTAYTKDELLGALVDLKNRSATVRPHDFRDQLFSALHQGIGSGSGASPRLISTQDQNALDMVNNLLTSLYDDQAVSEGFRAQVNRLQVPFNQLALRDPAFLSERAHPARELVNRLAQLQDPRAPRSADLDDKVRGIVDTLLDRLSVNTGSGTDLYASALAEVNALAQHHAQTCVANLNRVVTDCEEQQVFLRAKRQQSGITANEHRPPPVDLPSELVLWMDRARRLRTGDSIRFVQRGGKSQDLALAWIGEDYNPFVFVDRNGDKANSLTLQELAMMLRRGTANIVDQADVPAVDRALRSVLYKMHERIEDQAVHDPVTGLMNHKKFLNEVDHALIDAARNDKHHAFARIQLTGHEPIIKKFGQKAVDKLLRKIAAMLTDKLPEPSIVARLDAASFGVLLRDCAAAQAEQWLLPCVEHFEESRVKIRDEKFTISLILGITAITADSQDRTQVLAETGVDIDAQAAADQDEISVVRADAMNAERKPAVDWSDWLSRALAAQQVELYGLRAESLNPDQPQCLHVAVRLGAHDAQGQMNFLHEVVLPPELDAQVQKLDRLVIQQCLKLMSERRDALERVGGCNIVLHAASLADDDLINHTLNLLIESNVPPGKVCFELREAALLRSPGGAERLIRTLREFGCRFCLAGFGGTSIKHDTLDRLAVDYLKIDRLFIKDIEVNPQDYAMVKSVAEIGHLLGKKIVAEQPDHAVNRNPLRSAGVDYVETSLADLRELRELF